MTFTVSLTVLLKAKMTHYKICRHSELGVVVQLIKTQMYSILALYIDHVLHYYNDFSSLSTAH